MRRPANGFTIPELLVALAVIAILLSAAFSIHASTVVSQRNTQRKRDIAALQLGLEGYYSKTNHYPTRKHLNSKAWRVKNIKALDKQALRDPLSKKYGLVSKPTQHRYAYTPTSQKGKSCNNQKTPCQKYTLTTELEGGGTYTKQNLN
jgi:prepilin-type N-terminal cleavage/methylation domain-containing protein